MLPISTSHQARKSWSVLLVRVASLFVALILAIGCTWSNSEFASIPSIDSRVVNGSLTEQAYVELPPDLSQIYVPEGTRVRHMPLDHADVRQARVLTRKTVANMDHPRKFHAKEEFGTLGIEYCALPQAIAFREYGTRDGRPERPIWFTIEMCIEVPESVQVHHLNLIPTKAVSGQDAGAWRHIDWTNISQRSYESLFSNCESIVHSVVVPTEN